MQYWIWNPHRISESKKKNYSNRSGNNKIGLLWSRQSFRESTMSDFESLSNFQVKEKKIFKSVQVKEEEKIFKSVQKQRNRHT